VSPAAKLRDELIARKAALSAQLIQQFGSWLVPIDPMELQEPFIPPRDDKAKGYIADAPLTRLTRASL
jgi:hypothetical protein